jgi:uncharacterized membrane protein HdeD (DUF308 family)
MPANPAMSMPHPPAPLLNTLTKRWWLLLLRGIAAIVFGVLAFAWPGVTLLTLVILYGAFALVDGVLALAAAFGRRASAVPKWWLILTGMLGIGAGLVAFFWPGITAFVLVMFIGAWALVRGIFEIIAAIQLRKEIEGEWLLILAGLISVLFGLGVLIFPGAGALALVWVIAAYAIAIGVVMVMLALRLRSHRSATAPGTSSPPASN